MNAWDAIDEVRWFGRYEFPDSVEDVDARLIFALDILREKCGFPIYPSRHPDGWVRYSGSEGSRHHFSNADAGDVFPARPLDAMLVAFSIFGGVGIYYDTQRTKLQPGAMLHVDLRPDPSVWCRHEGQYIYPLRSIRERKRFWHLANLYSEGRL